MQSHKQKVLLTGATGFVGSRLLRALVDRGIETHCLVRPTEELKTDLPPDKQPKVVSADLLEPDTLGPALEGTDSAYYLVHSMGGRSIRQTQAFAERDRRAAENFIEAADRAGLKRIIYLGGLGETGDKLSGHLSSRLEVARILQSGAAQTTVLRAAIIIGAGGASFEMLRHLVERLPVMMCPRWIETRSQPISVHNAIDYLVGCLLEPATAGLTLDIGGPDILTYRELMNLYARVRGLRRFMFTVPVLTPHLSSLWVGLVTPVPSGLAIPLVEGLKNEVVCRNNKIRELVPIDLMPMEEAIRTALAETTRAGK
jgi:uncharacterized protein YbjT (DUF2867 family)